MIVITGGNRGIGLGLVKQYVLMKKNVLVICRRSNQELRRLGVRVIENIDLSNINDIKTIIKKNKIMNIELLIHNAGYLKEDNFDNIDYDAFIKHVKVNAAAPLFLTKELDDFFLPKKTKIVIISSVLGSNIQGIKLTQDFVSYSVSKAAVNMVANKAHQHYSKKSIAVCLIHPGYVRTRMTEYKGELEISCAVGKIINTINKIEYADMVKLVDTDFVNIEY